MEQTEHQIAPDDPSEPPHQADAKPLAMMICAALAATVVVLGVMWMNSTGQIGSNPTVVAERHQ